MRINQLQVGTTPPIVLRLGATLVDRAYLGSVLVYGEQEAPAAHTVFGTGAPAYAVAVHSDGTPAIECGAKFYLSDDNGPAIGWRCKGGRVWLPNDPSVTGRPITLRAFVGWQGHDVEFETTTPSAAKSTTTPVAGGWCEVEWDEPFIIDYEMGENVHVVISYAFTSPSDQAKYLAASGVPSTRVASGDIGTTLVLAEASAGRGAYRIGAAATSHSGAWYGADIIVEEAPSPVATPPIAAYNFNEASGTVIGDATGHGYALATQSQYFTANGHAGSGLQQLAADTPAVDGPFIALDTSVQQEFTIMLWGKYDNAGVPGDNWVICQTVLADNGVGWGIMLSNGTDAVFGVRAQGVDVQMTAPRQTDGQWHHYALSGNGYYARAYVDGVLVSEYPLAGKVIAGDNDHNLRIFGGSMQGQTIDDLRFFAYALNPEGIQYYMNRNI